MTSSAVPVATGLLFRPAREQTTVPMDKVIHSANAGFIVHRSGLIKYEFRTEGLQFGLELVEMINSSQAGNLSVFLYEELLGTYNRLHWILHMRQPNDYARLLDMVDHDAKWREIADMDRLPARGGGGWDRIFIEGSIQETVICPQHGVGYGHDEDHGTFQPPARCQTRLPADQLLNSANSALIVHRTAQAAYALREEARLFSYEWAGRVNTAMAGRASAFLYEEMWGRQDRLHTLIHLGSLDAYQELLGLPEQDEGLRELLARQWVPGFKGGGGWERLFIDATIVDTVLMPRHRDQRP
jgi:hypothetical protein